MMLDFFISYSHQDNDQANKLVDLLKQENVTCFIDRENLQGGDDWADKITDGISEAKAFIILCSPDSITSYQVLSEVVIARNRRKPIIPIIIRDIDFSTSKGMEYHLCAYQMINAVGGINAQTIKNILYILKNSDEYLTSKEILELCPPKGMNIIAPKILTTEELLNLGYSKKYISMKHIELDYLTVNPTKYEIVEEIEGTMDTWMDMIGLTADSSAQLVSNNEIVGYLDFIPVEKDAYQELITNKRYFTEDLAVFTGLGGDFCVYGSMFSMNSDYATPSNYLLFAEWFVNRLLMWKKEDVNIEKITFSIYMDSQEKVLKSLGFKEIFRNRVKGALLEISYKDLMKNEFVVNKIINKNIRYNNCTKYDSEKVNECENIARSFNVNNGGTLHFTDLVKDCDYIITAEDNGHVIGFVGLKYYPFLENAIYVEQIAVSKGYQHRHIASTLLNKAIKLAQEEGVSHIIANVRKDNRASFATFEKQLFNLFEMKDEDYLSLGFDKESINQNAAFIKNI